MNEFNKMIANKIKGIKFHSNDSQMTNSSLALTQKETLSYRKHILLVCTTKSLDVFSRRWAFILWYISMTLSIFYMDRLLFSHIHLKVNV